MDVQERQAWQALQFAWKSLRETNALSLGDVVAAGFSLSRSSEILATENTRFQDCESQIQKALQSRWDLLWWLRRISLGNYCRAEFNWFDRSTDDSFDWTKHAQAIRAARDEVDRCLKVLGF